MRKLFLIFSLISLMTGYNCSYAQVSLSYNTIYGEKIILEKESYYDIESKPMIFDVGVNTQNQDSFLYRVEIFRLLSSEKESSQIRKHFYKCQDYTISKLSQGINMADMFTSSSHSLIAHGFVIRFSKFRKYDSDTSCEFLGEYKIIYDE